MNSGTSELEIQNAKRVLRIRIQHELSKFSPAAKMEAARRICDRYSGLEQSNHAGTILFFAALADEPDVWPLISSALQSGRRVALPRFNLSSGVYSAAEIRDVEKDVSTGKFGVREPAAGCSDVPLNRLDLALVPGVAFDARGMRLGRGKGFYDRLLAEVRAKKIGVAFDEQIVDAVPSGPKDIRLDCILTPTRWIET